VQPTHVDDAIKVLERSGFNVVPAQHLRARRGFLAGSDEQRVSDLHQMFADPRVAAIFCLRGGYGTGRLLHQLDYSLISANPKILAGYSDLTALEMALLNHCGLVTFHASFVDTAIVRNDPLAIVSWERLIALLSSPGAAGNLFPMEHPLECWIEGAAEGRLIGGNLTLLASLAGTPHLPSAAGALVFLEEIAEAPYRIDRLLTQLLNIGWLKQAAGFLIGNFNNCEDPRRGQSDEYRQTWQEVLRERLGSLNVPILANCPFGHCGLNCPMPIGTRARMNASSGVVELLEYPVS
jgi:muramoyltetrapeptide carboxypeptidase